MEKIQQKISYYRIRDHLAKCFQIGNITEFPSTAVQRMGNVAFQLTPKTVCICRGIEIGPMLICCGCTVKSHSDSDEYDHL